jgi:hypothetical protein
VELAGERRRQLARIISGAQPEIIRDPELLELARSEGVLPLLQWLAAGGAAGEAADALRPQAALQLARRARLVRLLGLLAAEGVVALVIKGAHLAYACYPDPALRPHVDTDLLIDPADVEKARGVFERSGHGAIPHVSGRFVMSQFHYVDGGTGGAHAYDVHWRVANPLAFRDVLPFDTVRRRAVRLPAMGPHAFGPCRAHALVIACIHRAAHHGASDRLVWLNDLRLLLRSASPAEVDEFSALADAGGINAVCHDACARAADLFGDVQVPDALAARARSALEPTRAYLDAPSPMRQLWLDFRALRAWPDRGALLREHLFPPPAYVRATSRGPLAWAYATRVARGFFDWTRLKSF